jgi:glycosyltransferase involved in cell wall biosynthesis
MVTNCPIIAANASSIPEVCGDCAIYFNPFNEQDIANCIRNVINSEIYEGVESLKYNRVEKFSWIESATKISDLIIATQKSNLKII